MRNIKFLFMLLFVSAIVFSCDEYENTAEESQITYLPKLTMNGASTVILDCTDTSFDDPGLSAEEAGQSLEVTKTVTAKYFGDTEITSPDLYNIQYSATNKDGIPGAESRTVLIPACNGDLITDISGMYASTITRITGAVESSDPSALQYVFITKTGDDTYALSHGIGGYYDYGLGYGADYASLGAVITPVDGGYSVSDATFPVWGNVIQISDFTVDAGTKTITYHGSGNFGNGEFDIVMTQVEL